MIRTKTEEQIAKIAEACRIVKGALEFAGKKVCAGMTTAELNEFVHRYVVANGGNPSSLGYYGFPAACCVSVNEEVVHGIPGDRVIEDGDIVTVDLTVEKDGWQGDACRTFCVGNVSEDKRKLVRVTEECFFQAVEHLRAGTPLGDIGAAVQEHAESNGYGVIREFVGHGIGREMHEDPNVPNFGKRGTGVRLRANTVICIEPMIAMGTWRTETLSDGWTAVTADRKPAAHYENTVVIRPDGVQILTL